MIVKLLTEHHLEFLSLKGGCRGSSESTHVKMPNCWKSHAAAHMSYSTNIDWLCFIRKLMTHSNFLLPSAIFSTEMTTSSGKLPVMCNANIIIKVFVTLACKTPSLPCCSQCARVSEYFISSVIFISVASRSQMFMHLFDYYFHKFTNYFLRGGGGLSHCTAHIISQY